MDFAFDHQLLSKHAHALVEPGMVEYLPPGMATTPIVPAAIASSVHLMPRLLDLAAQPEEAKAALLAVLFDAQRNGEQPPVTLFVRTAMDADELARHWNGLQVAAPAPERRVWLRLHDPRVLHQVLRILAPTQRRKLFGRIEAFRYWIGDDWIDATAGDADASARGVAPAWDWPRIEDIGIVNRALQAAGVRRAADMGRQGELAEELVARARTHHGLVDGADLVEFAMRGLRSTPGFDAHPDILRAIAPSADPEDDSRLADRFALIDDQVWAGLNHFAPTEQDIT